MRGIEPSPLGELMQDLMLPLFFFISGFCAWSDKTFDLPKQFLGKVRGILIPTIVMFTAFMFYTGNDIKHYAMSYDKSGYWFTWVLFQIFVIYLLSRYAADKLRNRLIKVAILLSPLVLMAVAFHFVGFDSQVAVFFEWVKVKGFYLYFIAGVFLRIFKSNANQWLHLPLVNTILLFAAFASYRYIIVGGGNLLIMCVLSFFIFQQLFKEEESQTLIAKVLTQIGRNSLAIYFLHFFLLFRVPQPIVNYISSLQTDSCFGTNSCSSLAEFLLCMTIAIILCYSALIIKRIVTLFPYIDSVCFGSSHIAQLK